MEAVCTSVSRADDNNGKRCQLLLFAGTVVGPLNVFFHFLHEKQVPSVSLPFTEEETGLERLGCMAGALLSDGRAGAAPCPLSCC